MKDHHIAILAAAALIALYLWKKKSIAKADGAPRLSDALANDQTGASVFSH